MDNRISFEEYLEEVSSSKSTPGGGHVAARVNALGCSLMLMSLRIAVLKRNPEDNKAIELEARLLNLRDISLELAEKDSESFRGVMRTWKDGGEPLEKALEYSAEVSKSIAEASLKLIDMINGEDISRYKNIITDVGLALRLAGTAFDGGIMNLKINASSIKDASRNEELIAGADNLKKKRSEIFNVLIARIEKYI